jgi:hypothetical protein
VNALKYEMRVFEDGLQKDKDLSRVKRAHAKLGEQVPSGTTKSGDWDCGYAVSVAIDQAIWFWWDLFDVYALRLLGLLKDIPIPRYAFP